MCRRGFKCSFLHSSRSLLLDNGASTFWISTSAFSSWLPICSSEGPSVRPRGRPQSDDLQKQLWIHFSHLHSRLKAIFQTADSSSSPPIFFPPFFAIIFFPSFWVRLFLRKEEFHCKFFFLKITQQAVNRLSFIFAESILDAHRLNIFIRAPADTNLK